MDIVLYLLYSYGFSIGCTLAVVLLMERGRRKYKTNGSSPPDVLLAAVYTFILLTVVSTIGAAKPGLLLAVHALAVCAIAIWFFRMEHNYKIRRSEKYLQDEETISSCLQKLRQDEDCGFALSKLADIYFERGDYAATVRILEKLIQIEPSTRNEWQLEQAKKEAAKPPPPAPEPTLVRFARLLRGLIRKSQQL